MMTLITGGSKCGKSSLAESLLDGAPRKLYIATMIPYGEEAHAAIARHRRLRAGRGFETLELYTDLQTADAAGCSVLLECLGNLTANELFREEADPVECGVLPECLGNLTANELFREEADPADAAGDPHRSLHNAKRSRTPPQTAAYIKEGLLALRAQAENLVIVTNQVGSDGITYEPGTMDYIRVLGEVNQAAAQMADLVIECVYGIPIVLKGCPQNLPEKAAEMTSGT